ncbi:S26 family signal peptidase [Streptomyces violaceus]|uniref:Mitochondrial inner membrane protease subunit 2 n=1 Tax=Streptomyces violaceus TaxID=1936 RepID=A0ABZ1P670_STRVL|nr:S26 family signal peptidase [Streptomyces violaceus]
MVEEGTEEGSRRGPTPAARSRAPVARLAGQQRPGSDGGEQERDDGGGGQGSSVLDPACAPARDRAHGRGPFAEEDRLLAARLPVRLVHVMSLMRVVQRGTVVAIKPTPGPRTAQSASPTCVIKRVAALPGEAVPVPGAGTGKVPAGHVYVLGDHRATSWDSRHAGPIPYERLTAVIVRRGDASTAADPTGA